MLVQTGLLSKTVVSRTTQADSRGRPDVLASLRDAQGLRRPMEERVAKRLFLVSDDPIAARRDGIDFLPWQAFLARLWDGDIV